MNLFKKQIQTHSLEKQFMVSGGRRVEGIGREFVIYIQTATFKMDNQQSPTV